MDDITRLSREEYLNEKRSQALRINEPELRELENKLKDIYVRKNQMCQMKENECKKLQDQIFKRRQDEVLRKQTCKLNQLEDEKRINVLKNNVKHVEDLKIQAKLREEINNIEKQKSCLENQQRIECLQKQHQASIQRLIKEKQENIQRTKNEMEIFKKSKEINAKKEELLSKKKTDEIERVNREREEQKQRRLLDELKKREDREAHLNEISSKLFILKNEARERTELIEKLQMHEMRQMWEQNNLPSSSKADKLSLGNYLKKQIEENVKAHKDIQELEDKYNEQILLRQKMQDAENENKEIIAKINKVQYSVDVLKQMESNEKDRKKYSENEQATYEYVRNYNQEVQQRIEEEKKNMTEEYKKYFSHLK